MKHRIFIDVDGTLIDKDDMPRPNLYQFFHELSEYFYIIVWSAGGADYATMKARRLDITKFCMKFDCKYDFKKRYSIGKGDICIDDEEMMIISFLRAGADGFQVPYYESNINDRNSQLALEDVLDKIKEKYLLK